MAVVRCRRLRKRHRATAAGREEGLLHGENALDAIAVRPRPPRTCLSCSARRSGRRTAQGAHGVSRGWRREAAGRPAVVDVSLTRVQCGPNGGILSRMKRLMPAGLKTRLYDRKTRFSVLTVIALAVLCSPVAAQSIMNAREQANVKFVLDWLREVIQSRHVEP